MLKTDLRKKTMPTPVVKIATKTNIRGRSLMNLKYLSDLLKVIQDFLIKSINICFLYEIFFLNLTKILIFYYFIFYKLSVTLIRYL